MVIYEWPGKFALVTEQRCGSSLLHEISEFEDSPLIQSKITNLDEWISKYKKSNKPIYVLCRDIHHKRSSAVNMQTHHNNCKDRVNFLNGIIHSYTERRYMEVDKCKFFNFCLNDSHIDWGTSVYYHFLRSKGVTNICLLWLQRPNLLESNITIQSLDNFLTFIFKDYPEIDKHVRKHHEELKKSYDHGSTNYTVDRMGMTIGEIGHIVILEAYNKAFRELTDHRNDVLKFSDWIWCEQFMNNTMISMYTNSGYDCPYTSTEVLDIVREKLDIMDMAQIKKCEEVGSLIWWPGKRFMMLCSDVYNNRSPEPADTLAFLDNAREALTNT